MSSIGNFFNRVARKITGADNREPDRDRYTGPSIFEGRGDVKSVGSAFWNSDVYKREKKSLEQSYSSIHSQLGFVPGQVANTHTEYDEDGKARETHITSFGLDPLQKKNLQRMERDTRRVYTSSFFQ